VAAIFWCTSSSVVNCEVNRNDIDIRFYAALFAFLGYDRLPQPQTRGQRIAHARRIRGLSMKALARAAGVDEATMRRAESGRLRMARRPMALICSYLGLSENGNFEAPSTLVGIGKGASG
jgi:hypothetical protein